MKLFHEKSELSVSSSDIRIIGILAGVERGTIVFSFKNGPVQVVKIG